MHAYIHYHESTYINIRRRKKSQRPRKRINKKCATRWCCWSRMPRANSSASNRCLLSLRSVIRCVAVCCSVLQCVAVCCNVLQCVAVCCSVLQCAAVRCSVAVCCSVLQCVAGCC